MRQELAVHDVPPVRARHDPHLDHLVVDVGEGHEDALRPLPDGGPAEVRRRLVVVVEYGERGEEGGGRDVGDGERVDGGDEGLEEAEGAVLARARGPGTVVNKGHFSKVGLL